MVLHTAFTGIFYSKMFVRKGILHVLYDKSLFSLACVSSETRKSATCFLLYLGHKRGSLCQVFLAETVKTGTKNRCVMEAMDVLRRKLSNG